ncbi:MAG: dynamin family protein [Thermoanaerobaculia bacterium]
MLETVLSEEQREILARERHALRELQAVVERGGGAAITRETLENALASLDELFLLVVVGEFNSGKSAFLNAFLGRTVLAEGVTPTTSRIHRITYGAESSRAVDGEGIEVLTEPVDFLRQVHLVDTPGTNALDREHEALTQEFIPKADLVLFVTSADRPFTESERAFLSDIREWGKKLVLVINKMDFLVSDKDRWKVHDFVRENAQRLLDVDPEIHLISAKQAFEGKRDGNAMLIAESRFHDLEEYITHVLDETERIRLKLMSPLGVGRRVAGRTLSNVQGRLEVLSADIQALEKIDTQLALYQEDLRAAFRFRLTDVDNELLAFEKRGVEFFDDTLRLTRALDLMNKDRIRAEFERKVVGETPKRLEEKVHEVIDWLVSAEIEQWQEVSARIERRRQSHAARSAGSPGSEGSPGSDTEVLGQLGRFDYNRKQLLDSVGRAARDSIDAFDQSTQAKQLAEGVRTAIAGTAVVEAGALGLGTLFTALATTQVMDITGILAASALALVGLFILPARKRKAKRELRDKIVALRTQLMDGLTGQFDREVEKSAERIQSSIAPYTRFVRAEGQTLRDLQAGLKDVDGEFAKLEVEIQAL